MTFIFDEFNRPEQVRRERMIRNIIIGTVFAALLGVFLYVQFKNYREEREVKRFLTALQAGNYQEAYQIWKPGPRYTFENFMRDWGPNGDYGKVENWSLERSRTRGSGVVVTATVNGKEARLWVERGDKSLGFPPF